MKRATEEKKKRASPQTSVAKCRSWMYNSFPLGPHIQAHLSPSSHRSMCIPMYTFTCIYIQVHNTSELICPEGHNTAVSRSRERDLWQHAQTIRNRREEIPLVVSSKRDPPTICMYIYIHKNIYIYVLYCADDLCVKVEPLCIFYFLISSNLPSAVELLWKS